MAKFNNRHNVKDADEVLAIICFRNFEMAEFQSDSIEPWEIPKSSLFDAGIRSGCDWHFYCGVTGIKNYSSCSLGESSGQSDYAMGLKYRKMLRKVKT